MVQTEPIQNREEWLSGSLLTREEVESAIENAMIQVQRNIEFFKDRYPSPATKDQIYEKIENIEWTNGFWTGLLWLCYEYRGDAVYRNQAEKNVTSFLHRVEAQIELEHHDLGFLYSLSCVAAYKLTGSETAKKAGLLAADKLMERFCERDGFIQAWGEIGKKDSYKLIIDAFLNIPLLYWASEVSGDLRYEKAADRHFETACNYVIREDASAYHTFLFDPETGKPVRGLTRQGYSDDSAWARGQSWGISGIPLNYRKNKNPGSLQLFAGMTNYFLNRLPEDGVCYWDLIFNDGSGQPRDSSAAAVAVCGIHEMLKVLPETNPDKETYKYAMHRILRSLIEEYAGNETRPGSPLLSHGVYSWHSGKGVDEGNIWGDYFYMEALMRFYKDWTPYW